MAPADEVEAVPNQEWQPTDIFLVCGTRIWPCHRAILIARSPYFNHYFKTVDSNKRKHCTLKPELGDEVASAVHATLHFMYTGDYDDEDYDEMEYETGAEAWPILFNVYVHAIAVRLDMEDLAALAIAKFSERAVQVWQSPGFADAVEEIYNFHIESRGALRDKVIEVCLEHSSELFDVGTFDGSEYITSYRRINSVLARCPAFREDLVAADLKRVEELRCACPNCEGTFVMRGFSIFEAKQRFCPYCGASWSMETWQKHARSFERQPQPHADPILREKGDSVTADRENSGKAMAEEVSPIRYTVEQLRWLQYGVIGMEHHPVKDNVFVGRVASPLAYEGTAITDGELHAAYQAKITSQKLREQDISTRKSEANMGASFDGRENRGVNMDDLQTLLKDRADRGNRPAIEMHERLERINYGRTAHYQRSDEPVEQAKASAAEAVKIWSGSGLW